jgi:hypothetical protein
MLRWSKWVLVEIALALLVLIPHVYIMLADENTILSWYHIDDAFYYFKTAQNISEGQGVTFDGLGPTNGFHPLWLLVCIPVFALARFDLVLPLRVLILILGLLNAGAGILLLRLGKRVFSEEAAVFVSSYWVLAPYIHKTVIVAGLESGINAFFLIWLWYRLISLPTIENWEDKKKPVLEIGFLAALAVLSRLDNVFVAFMVGLWLLWLGWQVPSWKELNLKVRWKRLFGLGLAYSIPIITLVGAYLLWNELYIGHLFPISSEVKQWWGSLGNTPYGSPPSTLRGFITDAFVNGNRNTGPWSMVIGPFLSLKEKMESYGLQELVRLRWFFLIGAVLIAGLRKKVLPNVSRLALVPLLLACLGQIAYYKVSGHVAQRAWYWVMEMFFIVLTMGVFLDGINRYIRQMKWLGPYLSRGLVSVFVVYLATTNIKYLSHRFPYEGRYQGHFYLDRSSWVTRNTRAGDIIAITGSGNLGYFTTERRIVNLDGLISNYDYFEHIRNGTGAEYLTSVGVDYVMGGAWITKLNPYQSMFQGNLVKYKNYQYEIEGVNQVLWRFKPRLKADQ